MKNDVTVEELREQIAKEFGIRSVTAMVSMVVEPGDELLVLDNRFCLALRSPAVKPEMVAEAPRGPKPRTPDRRAPSSKEPQRKAWIRPKDRAPGYLLKFSTQGQLETGQRALAALGDKAMHGKELAEAMGVHASYGAILLRSLEQQGCVVQTNTNPIAFKATGKPLAGTVDWGSANGKDADPAAVSP